LDELINQRFQDEGEPACPYLTNRKGRRIRPIPKEVRQFLKPTKDGGFKSFFEKAPPERRTEAC